MTDLLPPTATGAGIPPEPPGPLVIPGHQLEPSRRADRRLRRWTVTIGALTVALIVLGFGISSATTWWVSRDFTSTPVTTPLGRPTALHLTSSLGDVRVLTSEGVDEVTLALVEPGSEELPTGQEQEHEQVQAALSQSTSAKGTTVEVRQPSRTPGMPWTDRSRDVLVLVPADLELSLTLRADVGSLLVDGDFAALDAHSDLGDLLLGPLTAPGGVSASTDVGTIELGLRSPAPTDIELTSGLGEVELELPTDASGRVEIRTDTGSIRIIAPGDSRWSVRADAEIGEVTTAPGISGRGDDVVGTLTAITDLGDIEITR